MCWNAKVSLESFLFGAAAIIIAAYYHLPLPLILFYATIAGMQFVEYIVWTYGSDPDINLYASFAGAFLIFLQPISSILTLPTGTGPLLSGYVLCSLTKIIASSLHSNKTLREIYRMEPGKDGHLVWGWLNRDPLTIIGYGIYFIFAFIPIFLSKDYNFASALLITLGVSMYSLYMNKTWGSLWCWLVNGLVIAMCAKQVWKSI